MRGDKQNNRRADEVGQRDGDELAGRGVDEDLAAGEKLPGYLGHHAQQ